MEPVTQFSTSLIDLFARNDEHQNITGTQQGLVVFATNIGQRLDGTPLRHPIAIAFSAREALGLAESFTRCARQLIDGDAESSDGESLQ